MFSHILVLRLMMKTLFLASAFAVFCCIPCFSQAGWTNFNTTNSPLLDDIVSAIAIDHDNNLWGAYAGAGGLGNGIVRFDGNQWTHFNSLNSGLPNDDIRAIAVDMHGNLWFANYNAGMVKFNGATWIRYNTSNSNIPTDILIKDMMGRQVMKSRVSAGSERIELSFLQSGCYIIMLVGDNKISRSFKFIKSDR